MDQQIVDVVRSRYGSVAKSDLSSQHEGVRAVAEAFGYSPELAADLTAYVGCIAGAIGVEDYQSGLQDAGFSQMEIVDTGSDLNAYAKVEPQSGCCCCGPSLPVVESAAAGCCSSPPAAAQDAAFHKGMGDLCSQYDFNEYAASVKIYAIKR